MSGLILTVRSGETLLINGAIVNFQDKCRVELPQHEKFVFGKQFLQNTENEIQEIYLALQYAYAVKIEERENHLQNAKDLAIKYFETCSPEHQNVVKSAIEYALKDD